MLSYLEVSSVELWVVNDPSRLRVPIEHSCISALQFLRKVNGVVVRQGETINRFEIAESLLNRIASLLLLALGSIRASWLREGPTEFGNRA